MIEKCARAIGEKIDVDCCDRGEQRVRTHNKVEERSCSLRKLKKPSSGRVGAREHEIRQLVIGSVSETAFSFSFISYGVNDNDFAKQPRSSIIRSRAENEIGIISISLIFC